MFETIKHLKFTQQVLAVIIFISFRGHCYSIHSSTTSATIVWLCCILYPGTCHVDESVQKCREEREAKAAVALRKKERAEGIAEKWGLPWPLPDRKGQWGRISNEFLKKQQLYATIQRIVEGREQEPEIPPHKTVGSLGDSTHSEGQDVEGITQGGEGSTQGESRDGETSHQRDRLTKLHRPKILVPNHDESSRTSYTKDGCDKNNRTQH